MLYTSAAESAASLQEGLSQVLTDGELSSDEFKLLEFKYDFLRFVNSEIQKAPGNCVNSQEKVYIDHSSFTFCVDTANAGSESATGVAIDKDVDSL